MIASLEDHLVQDNFDLQRGLIARAEGENLKMAQVQALRVVMEDRRWYAGKVFCTIYGDDPSVSVNQQQVQIQVSDQQLSELRERLEAARQLRRGDNVNEKST